MKFSVLISSMAVVAAASNPVFAQGTAAPAQQPTSAQPAAPAGGAGAASAASGGLTGTGVGLALGGGLLAAAALSGGGGGNNGFVFGPVTGTTGTGTTGTR